LQQGKKILITGVIRTAEQSGYSQTNSRLSELVDTNSTSLAWKQNETNRKTV